MVLLLAFVLAVFSYRTHIARMLGLRPGTKPNSAPQLRFPMQITVKKRLCYRYDLVPIVIETRDSEGRLRPLSEPPTIQILSDGEPQATVGNVERLRPRYIRAAGQYRAWWPVPWNAKPGKYLVEVRCPLLSPQKWQWDSRPRKPKRPEEKRAQIAEMVCRASFVVKARQPAKWPKGFCAVTWEAHPPTGRILCPDGTRGDWRALLDWAEFMGADALWCRGAITEVNRNWSLSMQQPFAPIDEDMMHKIAREAHRRGLKFGTWAVAFSTHPARSNAGKPPYRYAQRITSAGAVDSNYISLLDPDRPRHIGEFFKRMAQDPNIDMLGLDYFRPDPGSGYEISDLFTQRMPLDLPDTFLTWPQMRRWRYVARKVELQWRRDPQFYEQWNWFIGHLLSQRLREIRQVANTDKPIWIFMFGWYHGQQVGQDPYMLTDAGADGLAVMLYQIQSLEHFAIMTDHWREYMQAGYCNLMPGDQVDFFWHQNMTSPRAAPEELYRRILVAHTRFQRGSVCIGAFWHDISRAIGGRLGPYPGREWALAGAAAFSVIRRNWKVQPVEAFLDAPEKVAAGAEFEVKLRLKSITSVPIRNLTISFEPTENVQSREGRSKRVAELLAGAEMTVPWRVRVTSLAPGRANRFMVAFRITWPRGDYGENFRADAPPVIVVMRYVQAQ